MTEACSRTQHVSSPSELLRAEEERVAKAFALRREDVICEALVEVLNLIREADSGGVIDCSGLPARACLTEQEFIAELATRLTKFRFVPTTNDNFWFTVSLAPSNGESGVRVPLPPVIGDDMDAIVKKLSAMNLIWKTHFGVCSASVPGENICYYLDHVADDKTKSPEHIRIRKAMGTYMNVEWRRYQKGTAPLSLQFRSIAKSLGIVLPGGNETK